ncbi:hypothetical protein IE53DRAFT_389338 [Violaceomyces palustris]|uniref:Uncharacterized protein n=1 Tax=Violaceomyces palustris TaxID=1673888 RepID=A0ACD0NRJ4_9BASI|nr:hypothetical protein IE53DRAFT_389338 [Violaceomyces palustris]
MFSSAGGSKRWKGREGEGQVKIGRAIHQDGYSKASRSHSLSRFQYPRTRAHPSPIPTDTDDKSTNIAEVLSLASRPADSNSVHRGDFDQRKSKSPPSRPTPSLFSPGQDRPTHSKRLSLDSNPYTSTPSSSFLFSLSPPRKRSLLPMDNSQVTSSPPSLGVSRSNSSRRARRPTTSSSLQRCEPDPSFSQTQDWKSRARRWSNSLSLQEGGRRMSLSSLGSSASPYIRAGLEELRSIFDVDSLQQKERVGSVGDGDLEGCALEDAEEEEQVSDDDIYDATTGRFGDEVAEQTGTGSGALGLFGKDVVTSRRRMHSNATTGSVSGAPLTGSPIGLTSRDSFTLSPHRQSSIHRLQRSDFLRKHTERTGFEDPDQCASPSKSRKNSGQEERDRRDLEGGGFNQSLLGGKLKAAMARSRNGAAGGARSGPRPALVGVGLIAIAVGITSLCAYEVALHPDATSPSLLLFVMMQPLFACTGLFAQILSNSTLMDASSRLIKAHVLVQAMIAIVAFKDLSASASYPRASSAPTPSFHHPSSSSARSLLGGFSRTDGEGLVWSAALSPHETSVGSFRNWIIYLIVFMVQAAFPILVTLAAQYRLAIALSILSRAAAGTSSTGSPSRKSCSLPSSAGLSRKGSSASSRSAAFTHSKEGSNEKMMDSVMRRQGLSNPSLPSIPSGRPIVSLVPEATLESRSGRGLPWEEDKGEAQEGQEEEGLERKKTIPPTAVAKLGPAIELVSHPSNSGPEIINAKELCERLENLCKLEEQGK